LEVELNDPEKHFEELIRFFFMFHDPTTENRQGADVGSQYASFIFTCDKEQNRIAKAVTQLVQEHVSNRLITSYEGPTVMTVITQANEFYAAEEEHQMYLEKNVGGYCNHGWRFKEWPKKS